ncbi:DUF4190 domain-containing protein [Corallococcus terminator]|uniref:DUF4190 domain-containing protein n=1 Tax=Corallococcus terminator TaxID=2316733 RepID=A0A3A8J020_9BACT|nr:DUF4190 domain-containing protein [Corallococcus terminator]RKG85350.1 DUF4190 domain-containing protein [Corallococcus terminator]
MSLEVPPSAQPHCAVHPDVLAGGTCSRCGGFICADCVRTPLGSERIFCVACSLRPEVDYLEAFRLEYWGRRDSWAWTVGMLTLSLLLGVFVSLASGGQPTRKDLLLSALLLASVPVGGAFFLGKSWARHLLVATPFLLALGAGVVEPAQRFNHLLSAIPFTFAAVLIHRDVRTRLFFRQPVTPGALRAMWNRLRNNPIARQAFHFGFSSLLMPLLSPIAVVCGVVGLMRVNPRAHPPIGRRGQAIAGIVLGVVSPLLWVFVLNYLDQRFGLVRKD